VAKCTVNDDLRIIYTVRSKIKKIEIAMINTLQLAARKNLIEMSLQW
jgi:mRNA-degrading endonuclease YafQ of YafQ-DinJ toxin-antitoxin module